MRTDDAVDAVRRKVGLWSLILLLREGVGRVPLALSFDDRCGELERTPGLAGLMSLELVPEVTPVIPLSPEVGLGCSPCGASALVGDTFRACFRVFLRRVDDGLSTNP